MVFEITKSKTEKLRTGAKKQGALFACQFGIPPHPQGKSQSK